MSLYLKDPDVELHHGDALEVLRGLPDGSVDCCITSPPYWSLRDYGTEGQLGLEASPEEYVAGMVAVFREVRRVLSDHGTLWCNLGDSYLSNVGGKSDGAGTKGGVQGHVPNAWGGGTNSPVDRPASVKPKDLAGVPWMLAFALRADGWYLRSDIIWSKPNPMPESVTDRPTKSHEYVFLLSKRPRYFFDQEAVRERYEEGWKGRLDVGQQSRGRQGFGTGSYSLKARGPDGRRNTMVQGADGSLQHRDGERWPNGGRNVRSVWEIATQPYPEAHFATYPEELVRRCILAGCPEWVCRSCGKPRERITSTEYENPGNRSTNGPRSLEQRHETAGFGSRLEKRVTTEGFSDCGHGNYRPGVVLDPFVGSGTTCLVARKHSRRSIGIDLNADYLALAADRLAQQSLFAQEASA